MSDDAARPATLPSSGVLPLDFLLDARGGMSRRGFLSAAALTAFGATLAACGDASGIGVNLPAGVTANGNTTQISLTTQTGLATTGGYLVIENAMRSVIVMNLGSNSFRALSAVCTHQTCLISGIVANSIICNCHGSQFTTTGQVVVGPARSSLAQFGAVYDALLHTVTVKV